jgi:hypothetical protein
MTINPVTKKDHLVCSINGKCKAILFCQNESPNWVKDQKFVWLIQSYDPFISPSTGLPIKEIHSEYKDECLNSIKEEWLDQLTSSFERRLGL